MTLSLQFRSCATTSERGFTLVELLAVTAILSMLVVATLGTMSGAGYSSSHHARMARGQVIQGVQRARQAAVAASGSSLRTGGALRIASRLAHNSLHTETVPLPAGWSTQIDRDREAVRFDADGASEDFAITILGPHSETLTLRVCGLSGEVSDGSSKVGGR